MPGTFSTIPTTFASGAGTFGPALRSRRRTAQQGGLDKASGPEGPVYTEGRPADEAGSRPGL